MSVTSRRHFLAGATTIGFSIGVAGCTPAPRAHASPPKRTLTDFGAIPDGTFDPATRKASGSDNTAAINAALTMGDPVLIPPGTFYYSGLLHTDVNGSGLVGSGNRISYLITDQSRDRHLAVVQGTRNTKWVNFGMIGPFAFDRDDFNRAITVGLDAARTGLAANAWDASGTWINEVQTYGYTVGLHVAHADNVRFGTIEVYEAGDSRAEPGSYGITCSGSGLKGRLLRAQNTSTRARHALYYTGPANDCFIDTVEATGFDFAPIRNRATAGGGQRNGFGWARLEDCNTNSIVEPGVVRGLVDFVCSNDDPVPGAGGARIGDYIARNCSGMPGPSLRYMPNSKCGTVSVYDHKGDPDSARYGAHIFRSDSVGLPLLLLPASSDPGVLSSSAVGPVHVEESQDCYGGGTGHLPPGAPEGG